MQNKRSFFLTPNQVQNSWIFLGLVALIVRVLFVWRADWCECFYSRGLYPYLHQILSFIFSWLPFPAVYLFVSCLIAWLLLIVGRFLQARRKGKQQKVAWKSVLSVLMSWIFWFLLLWGYNYARIPMETQLNLDVPEAMTHQELWKEAQYIKKTCIQARRAIPNVDTLALTTNDYPKDLELVMRQSLKEVLAQYNYDTSWQVSGRFLYKGALLRFNSAGVYFPFVGEGNIDGGLHVISKPFTVAHELAHGYGFGDEAVCNFWGFMACIHSKHPAIQYSGYLMYWRYVYGALMEFMTEEAYEQERATISRGMFYDIEAIYATMDAFPPFIPFLQPAVYDVFLKVQGVEEGIESYDRMVLLISSWRKQFAVSPKE